MNIPYLFHLVHPENAWAKPMDKLPSVSSLQSTIDISIIYPYLHHPVLKLFAIIATFFSFSIAPRFGETRNIRTDRAWSDQKNSLNPAIHPNIPSTTRDLAVSTASNSLATVDRDRVSRR